MHRRSQRTSEAASRSDFVQRYSSSKRVKVLSTWPFHNAHFARAATWCAHSAICVAMSTW